MVAKCSVLGDGGGIGSSKECRGIVIHVQHIHNKHSSGRERRRPSVSGCQVELVLLNVFPIQFTQQKNSHNFICRLLQPKLAIFIPSTDCHVKHTSITRITVSDGEHCNRSISPLEGILHDRHCQCSLIKLGCHVVYISDGYCNKRKCTLYGDTPVLSHHSQVV